MNNKPPFSIEYDINDTTIDSKSSIPQQSSMRKDTEVYDTITKMEDDYQLSKPIRKVIRARILPK